jgi:arylsulfatase
MDLLTGKSNASKRSEVFYFTDTTFSAVCIDDFKYRLTDQPEGWPGPTFKVNAPVLTNLRLDPFERTGFPKGANGSLAYYNWFALEFWRFQLMKKEVEGLAKTFVEYPPMRGGGVNLEELRAQIEAAIKKGHPSK